MNSWDDFVHRLFGRPKNQPNEEQTLATRQAILKRDMTVVEAKIAAYTKQLDEYRAKQTHHFHQKNHKLVRQYANLIKKQEDAVETLLSMFTQYNTVLMNIDLKLSTKAFCNELRNIADMAERSIPQDQLIDSVIDTKIDQQLLQQNVQQINDILNDDEPTLFAEPLTDDASNYEAADDELPRALSDQCV